MRKSIVMVAVMIVLACSFVSGQSKIDMERMDRDIAVAENALSTMIRTQFGKKQSFWMDVKANYTPGYGVTLRVPGENNNFIYEMRGRAVMATAPGVNFRSSSGSGSSYSSTSSGSSGDASSPAAVVIVDGNDKSTTKKSKEVDEKKFLDSARQAYYNGVIKASKDFLVDYGDLISQLPAEENILITNRGERNRYYYIDGKSSARTMLSIEINRGDITQYKLGKISRDQLMAKIKVVNTETTNEIETDLELFASMIGRLYRSDLSKTYYSDENVYYERLKQFGAIYYLSAYSSVEMNKRSDEVNEGKKFAMPTLRVEGLSQAERDKKVIELFPKYEASIKDNLLEYGKTIKSMEDNEMLVFNIQITKCVGCGIPANMELAAKMSVIRDFSSGKISKADALAKISVKRGPNQ